MSLTLLTWDVEEYFIALLFVDYAADTVDKVDFAESRYGRPKSTLPKIVALFSPPGQALHAPVVFSPASQNDVPASYDFAVGSLVSIDS